MEFVSLDGTWQVRWAPLSVSGLAGLAQATRAKAGWIKARVPGEIHLDLVRAHKMKEPLVGLNAKESRWPEARSWWYKKAFTVPASFLCHERQQLVFDGLDLYAQVFLNGELLGEAKNAFVPHAFDVRHRLKQGKNTLAVRLTSGEELVAESLRPTAEERTKRMAFRGISHLRKPQFTYGWDWVDCLPNIGIWRGVRLEAHSGVVLHDVAFATRREGESVALAISAMVENLHPWSERHGELAITIKPPRGGRIRRSLPVQAQVGRSPIRCTIAIPHPELWWPNGMGEQPLYHVTIEIRSEGATHDRREFDIGLRTIELDRASLRTGGARFCLRVNGQEVYCKGGNWIPADAILARVTKQKYEMLIADAKNANLNMLRVWGGGVYEAPEFYAACDRAGILVWQDFMFACAQYPDHDPEFRAAIRAEAESVVRALRHHPCIALWSGNNENIWGFADWWNPGKEIGEADLRLGGSALYSQILPEVCHALDPERPYWPGSPCGGARPNDESSGDCHWWHPCTMHPDVARRIDHEVFDECKARFVSEYGVIGPCHLDSIRQFLGGEELRVGSPGWKEHTNTFEKETTPAGIRRHYAEPEGLDVRDYVRYGQLFQATMYGRSIEALRFRKGDPREECQGAIIWMYDDCWGETGWTPIDYYLRRKASYYWIRQACAPVKAIVRRRGASLVTRIVNDTLDEQRGTAHYGWMRLDGTEKRMHTERVRIAANSMIEIARERIPGKRSIDPAHWIYAACIEREGVESAPSIWLLAPFRELAVARPEIRICCQGSDIHVSSAVYCHAVHCEDGGGRVFSDNYFDLLPGVPKIVRCLDGLPGKAPRFRAILP